MLYYRLQTDLYLRKVKYKGETLIAILARLILLNTMSEDMIDSDGELTSSLPPPPPLITQDLDMPRPAMALHFIPSRYYHVHQVGINEGK